jgi:uncharacterized protein (DUF302 family)
MMRVPALEEVSMQAVEYGIGRDLNENYEAVLPRVVAALKAEGFGVITEIDVQKTMKEKLGVDGRPNVIIGACNPKLAHAALGVEADLGLLLPCNVVVYETDTGTRVAVVNAGAMLGMVGNEALAPIAAQVQQGLDRVLAAV